MPFSSKEYARAYYVKNRERLREQNKAWVAAHPEVKRAQQERYRKRVRKEVLQAYGGACACCGTDYAAHLTLDHIDGGGTADRKENSSSYAVERRLRREGFPPGYQILCWNCNWAKHHEGACGCQGRWAL
jgi:hypothetical protein